MDSKAQSGLEYLMTYGWALILIAAVLGVLVFIVSSPASDVAFSSSDPTKIMVKSGAIQGTDAVAKLTNLTGGKLNISSISASGASYSTCTINEETTDIDIPAGSEVELNCPLSGEDPTGTVTIDYTDFAGLQREVVIRIAGGTGAGNGSPGELCESGGTGTEEDPYRITNAAELQAIINDTEAWYELCQDIDASETSTWNEGQGFEPITNFIGNLDGKGHEISGLYINRADGSYIGLFSAVELESAEVKNIGLVNVNITGDHKVSGLVAYNVGTITNCHVTGTISGGSNIGGLVGENSGQINNCYSTGSVSGEWFVGGLAGGNDGTISGSYATGAVTGENYAGGLAGGNEGTISSSYATGAVTGKDYVGGLAGGSGGTISGSYATGSATGNGHVGGLAGYSGETISRSYSTGTVTGTPGSSYVGGLVGENTQGEISDSFATGAVTGENYVGGFVGYNFATITNCYSIGSASGTSSGGFAAENDETCTSSYWDKDASGQDLSACGTGKTTVEMKQQATFTGWDFSSIWNINNGTGYPFLR